MWCIVMTSGSGLRRSNSCNKLMVGYKKHFKSTSFLLWSYFEVGRFVASTLLCLQIVSRLGQGYCMLVLKDIFHPHPRLHFHHRLLRTLPSIAHHLHRQQNRRSLGHDHLPIQSTSPGHHLTFLHH